MFSWEVTHPKGPCTQLAVKVLYGLGLRNLRQVTRIGSIANKRFPYHGNLTYLKGPCAQLLYTLAPMYLYRDSFRANVYTI